MVVGSLQPREGRNTGRRVETVPVAKVWYDETEATRAVTGRLTQTWGLKSGRGNVVGRDEGRSHFDEKKTRRKRCQFFPWLSNNSRSSSLLRITFNGRATLWEWTREEAMRARTPVFNTTTILTVEETGFLTNICLICISLCMLITVLSPGQISVLGTHEYL